MLTIASLAFCLLGVLFVMIGRYRLKRQSRLHALLAYQMLMREKDQGDAVRMANLFADNLAEMELQCNIDVARADYLEEQLGETRHRLNRAQAVHEANLEAVKRRYQRRFVEAGRECLNTKLAQYKLSQDHLSTMASMDTLVSNVVDLLREAKIKPPSEVDFDSMRKAKPAERAMGLLYQYLAARATTQALTTPAVLLRQKISLSS
jgi:hypothetical protein